MAITNALGYVATYSYDDLNCLVQVKDPLNHTTAYGYDAVGTRTVQTRTLTTTVVTTYQYDAANRLVNVDGVDYTWDDNPLRYAARTSWQSTERRRAHLCLRRRQPAHIRDQRHFNNDL
jgi:YD repeat-containing protein